MYTNNIKEFIYVAEFLSFGEAAKELGITVSALSRHISAIEEEIGAPLFERDTRNVRLSGYGEIFMEFALRFSDIQARYVQKLEQIREDKPDTLVIYSTCFLSGLIENFRKAAPEISVLSVPKSFHYMNSYDAVCKISAEIAFVEDIASFPKYYHCEPYLQYEYVLILPEDDPLCQYDDIDIDLVIDRPFAVIMNDWAKDNGIEKIFFSAQKKELNVCYRFNSIPLLMQFVSAEHCVGLVMRNKITEAHADGVAIRSFHPGIRGTAYMCYRSKEFLSAGAQRFIDFVHGEASAVQGDKE